MLDFAAPMIVNRQLSSRTVCTLVCLLRLIASVPIEVPLKHNRICDLNSSSVKSERRAKAFTKAYLVCSSGSLGTFAKRYWTTKIRHL